MRRVTIPALRSWLLSGYGLCDGNASVLSTFASHHVSRLSMTWFEVSVVATPWSGGAAIWSLDCNTAGRWNSDLIPLIVLLFCYSGPHHESLPLTSSPPHLR
ncbi:hypothetical protein LX36DRAFT_299372 [Colletotrichum falcatum]|nr:hypothetical protein LX36DRAFT_299372 [Colletotrichum falcatum]